MSHACHHFWKCYKTLTFCSCLQKWSEHAVSFIFWLRNVLHATTACTFSRSQLPTVLRTWCVLYTFEFEMCFAPQRRALFRHLNFQKWSEPGSFFHFWLRNVLRATTVCNFSSLIRPAGSAPAALASLLFDPPEPQMIGKTLLPFRAPGSSFFWDFLFLIFFLLLFSSLLFFDSYHLCFSSVHIVGSLTSKLPSIIIFNYIHIYLPPMGWVPQKYPSISYLYIPYPLPIIILYTYIQPISSTNTACWLPNAAVLYNLILVLLISICIAFQRHSEILSFTTYLYIHIYYCCTKYNIHVLYFFIIYLYIQYIYIYKNIYIYIQYLYILYLYDIQYIYIYNI